MARSTITGIGRLFVTRSTPKFLLLGRAGAVRGGAGEDEFEEERARAEKEEGYRDDEKDAKPMSKRSKAAAEKTRREAEEKDEKDAPRLHVHHRQERDPGARARLPTRLDAVEDARPRRARGGYKNAFRGVHLHARARVPELRDGVARRRDRRGVRGQRRARLGHEQGGPGRRGRVRDRPRARARAAKDAEMDAPAAERGEGGGDATRRTRRSSLSLRRPAFRIRTPIPARRARPRAGTRRRAARDWRARRRRRSTSATPAVHGVSRRPNEFLLSPARHHRAGLVLELETCLAAYRGHEAPVWTCAGDRGHYFATASNDKTARVWAMDSPTPRRVMTGHLADVDCVAWHPNVNYIATGSADKTVRMWDVATGECVRVFVGHVSGVRALALSPDGKSLASASEDGQVLAWDLGTARQTHAFVGHRGPVYSLDYAGGGRGICSRAGADETVRLWDTAVGVDPPTRRRRDKTRERARAAGSRRLRRKRGDTKQLRTNRRPCARCRSRGGTCSWPWARARLPRRRRKQVASSDSFRGTSSRRVFARRA